VIVLQGCAQQRAPDGGKKDENPPKVIGCKPENKSIQFNQEKIIIKFDEYIQIKDPAQIVISPFLKNKPLIEANGKNIEIEFLKSKPEEKTTYSINFANSITDINEGNSLSNFSYVFSTGNYLDSNKISGNVSNAFNNKYEKDILIGLYKINKFIDSIFSKSYPSYFTKSNDKGEFSIENLPNDTFILFAFKDASANNKYDIDEQVAFDTNQYITNKNYEHIQMRVFQNFQFPENKLLDTLSKQKGIYQFTFFHPTNIKVNEIHNKPTYQKWIKGKNGIDTLNVFISTTNDTNPSSFIITTPDTSFRYNNPKKIKGKLTDFTLQLLPPIKPNDTLKLISNSPIIDLNSKQFSLKEDTTEIGEKNIKVVEQSKFDWSIITQIKAGKSYSFNLKDSVIKNINNQYNKSINQQFNTKVEKDYGTILLNIKYEGKETIILQIVEDNPEENVSYTKTIIKSDNLKIDLIEPGNYKIKLLKDLNKNGIWDNGNIKTHNQPELMYYFEKTIIVKAYWDIEQTIDLDKIVNN
jgi:hypothetical protein